MPPKTLPSKKSRSELVLRVTFWLVFVLVVLSFSCAIVRQKLRMVAIERALIYQSYQVARLSQKIGNMGEMVNEFCIQPRDVSSTPAVVPMTNPLVPSPAPLGAAALTGGLTRGSWSPDGTKFAGYEELLKNKLGIAVETPAEKRVRHIVIFTSAESAGAGTPSEAEMSVRWKDETTIEYDVLVTANGVQTKKTETVKIGF